LKAKEKNLWRAKSGGCRPEWDRRWRREVGATQKWTTGGGDGDAEFLEFWCGEAVFVAAGVALDDSRVADAGGFLAEFDEAMPLRGGRGRA